MMSRSISQTTAAISQITTAITTMVMIKLNAPRTLLISFQLKGKAAQNTGGGTGARPSC
jgi:hypothetical protein